MNDYPFLQLIVKHGKAGSAVLAGLMFVLLAMTLVPALGSVAFALAALLAILLWGVGRAFTELVRLITDMLLPH